MQLLEGSIVALNEMKYRVLAYFVSEVKTTEDSLRQRIND